MRKPKNTVMMNIGLAALSAMLAAPLAGCFSYSSPYDYVENWLVREDPVRTFVIPADVIYVQSELYTKLANIQKMQDHVRLEVGQGRLPHSAYAREYLDLAARAAHGFKPGEHSVVAIKHSDILPNPPHRDNRR